VKKKNRRIIGVLLKAIIALFSFIYIFNKLRVYQEQQVIDQFEFSQNVYLLIFVLLLMPLNWFIESYKWKFLIRKIETLSIFTSIKAVFSGISFAIFTPNRIGELAGRIFVLKDENRFKGIIITGIGSFSQMIITVLFGLISTILFLSIFPEKLPTYLDEYILIIKILIISALLLGLFILFNLNLIVRFSKFLKIKEKFIQTVKVISDYSLKELLFLLVLCAIRYVLFSFQFILLLVLFNTGINIFQAFICISLTYLVSSVIPSFALTELGIRGSAALFFMGLFSANTYGIISATALLWIINLAIPALIGAVFFAKTKI
jgi:uncharacterized membrane protein YbhN (UPF0104 family)